MRLLLLSIFLFTQFCSAEVVQLVTYLNTRYPLSSPLKAWELTAELLSEDYVRTTNGKVMHAADLSREQFASWIKEQFALIPDSRPVLIYMSSHQEKNGDWRFRDGIMSLGQMAEILKDSIGDRSCLIINDSCHAAAWGKMQWPPNFQFIYISNSSGLNREINLWNDSPALARLYSQQIVQLREKGQGTTISYFGILWSGLSDVQIAFDSRRWPILYSTLESQDSLLRKKISRIQFPELLIR